MRKAILILLTLSFVISVSPSVYSQPKKDREHEISEECKGTMREKARKYYEKRIEKLTAVLSLSPEQKAKISGILKDGWEKLRTEREKMREKVKGMREQTDALIEKELTSEQAAKFREHKEEMKNRAKVRRQKKHKCIAPEEE